MHTSKKVGITLPLLLSFILQLQANPVTAQNTVVTERVGTSCIQHSDCIRYCSMLRRGVAGPSCCFAEKTSTAKGVLLTGSNTCYCCSWPNDFTPTGTLKDDNDNGCRSYMKHGITTTELTKEFCGVCKEAVMIAIVELMPPTSACQAGLGAASQPGDVKSRFRSYYELSDFTDL